MNCERCEKLGFDKCLCKKTYVFYHCTTPECDNTVWPVWDEYIKDGEGHMECENCGLECVQTTASNLTHIYPGNEVTFDHPDNPDARWGKVIKLPAMSYIQVENIGAGMVTEIRGLRR